ncbi:beta-N-acetylhexosaminidase [Pedobacter heparinus]|uniref:beta-N-acetylhexosaminidase n=1 Tax=Pedobacter heparinus (strain ATCC 13125 / DSM 2366 / CIP 104194 / JCM 7457 / NBRC 12017 / NCIMB 9290 / NRRL B-14731 / HIM 762-3) TaxID=485917 RepID=C6Y402_PEDHD|nr:beta-N-acetylhexosaminidase [Pedobacter heparinus]ACU05445.1 Beta-N-acetylhexosaminidase [Pedobacter heparinus DSM 2366]
MRIKKLLVLFLLYTVVVKAQLPSKSYSNIIPLPQKLQFNTGQFNLKDCKAIIVKDKSLAKEASWLQLCLKNLGFNVPIKNYRGTDAIILQLGKVKVAINSNEAYDLAVTTKKITVTSQSDRGIHYGIETLKLLTDKSHHVNACQITDWPAFSWRGYMIDAGRNFMPVALLKQQIDVMARYKLNVFHFHFTEDIAWRLESKLYPQLTNPETMLRNKGSFYTEADLKELISYCKDRYITLVPEIDMPGHSAAFKRAMKTDMQSDSGLVIVKNIIREFCSTYDVPYLHIGADEVKIGNKNFLPEVTRLIESLGKKVIGWEPGGNFAESTIRQLWMEGATKVSSNKNIRYIDSRHLYLNHMDPLESVVSIFNRKICNLDNGSDVALGGVICTWPDRRVNKPEDVLIQNPVYPAMLAFAERSWRGGGTNGWIANIGAGDTKAAKAFVEFEKRLLQHKALYFARLPFPYVKQTDLQWKLYGPFKNEGVLTKVFEVENQNFNVQNEPANLNAVGGTLILRHWWTPLVKGLLDNPEENTTWYAITRIWSDKDENRDFWIGFNNFSRSYASDSPKAATWDDRSSQVFVNSQPILAPAWKQAGLKGDMEQPLMDEGYEYRKPAKIQLKKGWNKVVVKLPIGSFKGTDWKNPQKWMFTFVPI